MFFELEDAAVVKTDAFEYPVTVEQPVIEDRNLGFALRHKLTIQENRQSFLRLRAALARAFFVRGFNRVSNTAAWFVDYRRPAVAGCRSFRKHEKTSGCSARIQAAFRSVRSVERMVALQDRRSHTAATVMRARHRRSSAGGRRV